ncbi:hypothetical protein MHBO_001260, partial [Bonamia ostreae]
MCSFSVRNNRDFSISFISVAVPRSLYPFAVLQIEGFLEAPVPFLVCINDEKLFGRRKNAVKIDVDNDKIIFPENYVIPQMPIQALKKLKMALFRKLQDGNRKFSSFNNKLSPKPLLKNLRAKSALKYPILVDRSKYKNDRAFKNDNEKCVDFSGNKKLVVVTNKTEKAGISEKEKFKGKFRNIQESFLMFMGTILFNYSDSFKIEENKIVFDKNKFISSKKEKYKEFYDVLTSTQTWSFFCFAKAEKKNKISNNKVLFEKTGCNNEMDSIDFFDNFLENFRNRKSANLRKFGDTKRKTFLLSFPIFDIKTTRKRNLDFRPFFKLEKNLFGVPHKTKLFLSNLEYKQILAEKNRSKHDISQSHFLTTQILLIQLKSLQNFFLFVKV